MKLKCKSTESSSKARNHIRKINARAAGIDIGSREHYVAVAPELREENVRKFGCYVTDHNN